MSTKDETSLSLAEDYVREVLAHEVFEQGLSDGDAIDVVRLDQCDCVPVDVSFDVGGRVGNWRLMEVKQVPGRRLTATYEWEPKR